LNYLNLETQLLELFKLGNTSYLNYLNLETQLLELFKLGNTVT